MKSDNELYIIQKHFPNSFVKLSRHRFDCSYEQHSIELKALKDTKDSFFFPESDDAPLIVIENQGYRDEDFFLRFNQGVAIYCKQNKYYGDVLKIALFLNTEHKESAVLPKYNCDFITHTFSDMTREELESFNDDALMSLLPLCKVTENEVIRFSKEWRDKINAEGEFNQEDKSLLYDIYNYFYSQMFDKTIDEIKKIMGVDILITKIGKEIYEEGREEGREETRIETARNLKKLNVDIKIIANATGLSIDEINKL